MIADVLCLDAGNVIVFLDHARLARLTGLERERLVAAEGEAKRAIGGADALDPSWSRRESPAWTSWGRVVATMLARAGMEAARVGEALDALVIEHERMNLWSRVPEELPEALRELRETGARVVVVSNSEGGLERLFEQLGLARAFDRVLDSAKVGFEKPDPRIFALALEGAPPGRAVHVGDTFATDVLGARAAGIAPILVDPHGHYAGLHEDVPRAESAAEVARAITRARKNR